MSSEFTDPNSGGRLLVSSKTIDILRGKDRGPVTLDGNEGLWFDLPTDPAERRRLAEAILQHRIYGGTGPGDKLFAAGDREVADVIYVDELPEVNDKGYVPVEPGEGYARRLYRAHLAEARYEQRVDDEQVEALAHALLGAGADLTRGELLTLARTAIEHLRGESE